MTQRYWEDIEIGDDLLPVSFPITVYRLVMAAGSNRDFNAIHHNSEVARASGAPDMYANTLFLQGMWERTVRNYIGLAGVIIRQTGFQMRLFNTVGETVTVRGRIFRKWIEETKPLIEIELWSETNRGITVGPGRIIAILPSRFHGN